MIKEGSCLQRKGRLGKKKKKKKETCSKQKKNGNCLQDQIGTAGQNSETKEERG